MLRVVLCAALLLGALAAALELLGQPSAAGSGTFTLPNPVSPSVVRYSEPPLKVLLIGDSMAGSLGVGLADLAPAYNVQLANAGQPGCSVSMDGEVDLAALFPYPPGAPCRINDPARILAVWQSWIDAYRPDVVVYLARSDLLNQEVHGQWTWIGHRNFNAWFSARLRAMLAVLTSRGARVVLMTVPVSQSTGGRQPQDNPIRVAREGKLLELAAASDPSRVAIYNLAELLTPGFRYRGGIDGLPLRCADGVHLTSDAGIAIAPDLFPRLWALVGSHRVSGGGRWGRRPVAADDAVVVREAHLQLSSRRLVQSLREGTVRDECLQQEPHGARWCRREAVAPHGDADVSSSEPGDRQEPEPIAQVLRYRGRREDCRSVAVEDEGGERSKSVEFEGRPQLDPGSPCRVVKLLAQRGARERKEEFDVAERFEWQWQRPASEGVAVRDDQHQILVEEGGGGERVDRHRKRNHSEVELASRERWLEGARGPLDESQRDLRVRLANRSEQHRCEPSTCRPDDADTDRTGDLGIRGSDIVDGGAHFGEDPTRARGD